MKVLVKNFRKHKSLSIDIDNGVSLLSGKNGRGKSTLLYAIYWCLYGDKKNVTSHGETNTFVSVDFGDILIKRSKPPNKLEIEMDGNDYEGEIAQEIINEYMGCEKNIFDISCFIRQKHKFSSLLSIGDQISIIEQLSQKGTREDLKQRFKNQLKNLKEQVEKYKLKILPEKERPEDLQKPNKKILQKDIDKKENVINSLTSQVSALETQLERELKKRDHNKICSEKRKGINEKIKELKKELEKYKVILDTEDRDYYSKYKSYQDIKKRRLDQLSFYQTELEKYEEKDHEKLNKKILALEEKIRDSEAHNIKVAEKERELKRLENLFYEILPSLKGISIEKSIEKFATEWSSECKKTECPFCENSVYYYMGKLLKKNVQKEKVLRFEKYSQVISLIEKIQTVLEEKGNKIDFSDLYEKKGNMLSVYKKIKSISLMIEVFENPGVEEQELKKFLGKKSQKNEKQMEVLEKNFMISEEMVAKINSEIQKLLKEKEKISFEEKDCYEETLENLKETRELLKSEMSSFQEFVQLFSENKRFEEYKKNLENFERVQENNLLYSQKILCVEQKITWTKSILEKIEVSGVMAMKNILKVINSEAKKHLERLFSYPVSVTLYNKRGDLVRLGVKIEVRNIPIQDIEHLGGGERERVELAFCLALNFLGGSDKILMFDESFSGVHPEAFTESIDYIREVFGKSRPVIVISQNPIEDCYDNKLVL